jgi:hypothetical protein
LGCYPCNLCFSNNPDPNLNLDLNNDPAVDELVFNQDINGLAALPNNQIVLNHTTSPTLINPDNFSPSGGSENLLIPERRFQDTALFKEIKEGNLSELIKSRESAKPVMISGYFSKDVNVEKVFSTLYGFRKI